jgi:hypothetical protein
MLAPECNMDVHAYPQKHALAAPSFFARNSLSHPRGAVRPRDR